MAGGTEAKDRSGIGSAVTFATAARQLRNGLRRKPTVATRWVGKTVAYIERRQLEQRDKSGRARSVVRYKVRYRDAAGKPHSETKRRLVDAERRKAEIELEVGNGLWRDPRRGEIRLEKWAADWSHTRHDLRLTTRTRLEITLKVQVLPRFGTTPLVRITNAAVRSWVAEMLAAGLPPPPSAKLSSPLRQCLDAAIANNRIAINPAISVPLPSEALKPPRFLSQSEVEQLVEAMPDRYKANGARWCLRWFAWGEAAGLTGANIDVLRSRITVTSTAVEVRRHVTVGHEPKTSRSKRSVSVARSVIRRLDEHLANFVGPESDALVFTAPRGGPLARSLFSRRVWRPAVIRAGIPSITFTRN
jgi:site-specific recombinase XerC